MYIEFLNESVNLWVMIQIHSSLIKHVIDWISKSFGHDKHSALFHSLGQFLIQWIFWLRFIPLLFTESNLKSVNLSVKMNICFFLVMSSDVWLGDSFAYDWNSANACLRVCVLIQWFIDLFACLRLRLANRSVMGFLCLLRKRKTCRRGEETVGGWMHNEGDK